MANPNPLQPHAYDPHEYHAAAERRRLARIADDLLTEPVDFHDSQAPGDGLSLVRSGPRGASSSTVTVLAIEGSATACVALSATTARKLAAQLLDFADEIDSPAEQMSRRSDLA